MFSPTMRATTDTSRDIVVIMASKFRGNETYSTEGLI